MLNNWSKLVWAFKNSKIKIFFIGFHKNKYFRVDSFLFFFFLLINFSASRLILLKESIQFLILMFLIPFNCCSFLPSIVFSIFQGLSFFSSSFKPLFKNLLNGKYPNLACSTVLGLRPRSSPVKYSYLSKLLEDSADILAAFLSESYCA